MAPLDNSPRHASPKQQRTPWQSRQLSGASTVAQPTVDAGMSDPAGSDDARVGGSAMVHAPAENRDRKHLRRAAEAAEAAAAHAAGAASQAAGTAERALADARTARQEATAAHAAAASVVGDLAAAREETTVLHQALEQVRARARRDTLIAWGAAGIALLVAAASLLTG